MSHDPDAIENQKTWGHVMASPLTHTQAACFFQHQEATPEKTHRITDRVLTCHAFRTQMTHHLHGKLNRVSPCKILI